MTERAQRVERDADGTERVLLLVRGERDRELLADRLGDRQVVHGAPDEALPEFDLCLVDTATYPEVVGRLRDRKERTPTYLPVLLVLGPRDSEAAAREVAEVPDDVLSVPASEAVFEARVASLLRARRQSVELDAKRREMALYRRAMDDAAQGITIAEADGDQPLTYVNDAFSEMTGYDRAEALGHNCRFLQGPDTDPEQVARMREAIAHGTDVSVELRNYRQDGSMFWNHVEISPVYADGELTHFLGFQQDVTERKWMEERLREETETLERLLETSPVGITVLDTDGEIVRANEAAEEVLGLERSTVVGRVFDAPAWDIVDEDGDPVPTEDLPFSRVVETCEPVTGYEHGIHVDGEERWLSISAAPLTDADGTITGVISAVEDVTERRERQRALDRERERFRTLAETASDAIVTIDTDGVVRYANSAVADVFGHDPAAVEGEHLTTLMPERFREDHERGFERYLRTGEPSIEWSAVRFTGLHADGHEVPLSVSFAEYEVAGEHRFTGFIRDVSRAVERERELERTVDLLDRTQEMADVGGVEYDIEADRVTWTAQTAEILGIEAGGAPSLNEALEHYHPEDRPAVGRAVADAATEREPFDEEFRVVRPDGEVRWIWAVGEPELEDDEVVGVRGAIQDITDRKERQRELEQYETVLENVPEGAWIVDEDRRITFVNSQIAEAIDASRSELIGREVGAVSKHTFRDPAALEAYLDTIDAILAGDSEGTLMTVETRTAGGEGVTEITLVPLERDGEVAGAVGLSRDVTERVERERELERTVDMLDRTQEIADVGGWEYDPDTGTLFWTEQVYAIHDIEPDREVGIEEAIEFYHPEDRATVRRAVTAAIEDGEPYDLEARLVRPDGSTRWVRTQGEPEPVDGGRVIRGSIQDIHERKRREQELERTVDQLRQTRDIADVSGWEYDLDTDELSWDERVREIYDLPDSFEPTGERVLDQYAPGDDDRVREAMRRAIAAGEPFNLELRLDREPTRWVEVSGEPHVEDGRTTGVRGVVRNVTGRKRRESFLERYERIVETASDPIYTLDEELRFTLVNDAAAEFSTDRELSLIGSHVADVFGEAHAETLADATTKLIDEGRERTTIETTVPDPDGGERQFQTTITADSEGEAFHGVVCVSRDITKLQRREQRLSVLDRVLRHNLRNKMNIVLAQAAMALEATDEASVAESIGKIEAAATELHGLAEDARRFHGALGPETDERNQPTDIAEHARHVVEEARLSYEGTTIEADLADVPPARTQPEFELALSELVDNAATHGGDRVTVSVTAEDDEVVVRVADDGPGFPDVERRALAAGLESPLQHTTGLGLWFVRWTATNSGGSFHIGANEPTGTVVELRLPVVDGHADGGRGGDAGD